MGNLTFSEIIWILVIILIVFGPQRLPEMARKVGQFVSKARDAATALQRQINEEYGETIAPLRDVGNEIKEVRRQLSDGARAAARDVEEAMTPPAFPPPSAEPADTTRDAAPESATPDQPSDAAREATVDDGAAGPERDDAPPGTGDVEQAP